MGEIADYGLKAQSWLHFPSLEITYDLTQILSSWSGFKALDIVSSSKTSCWVWPSFNCPPVLYVPSKPTYVEIHKTLRGSLTFSRNHEVISAFIISLSRVVGLSKYCSTLCLTVPMHTA